MKPEPGQDIDRRIIRNFMDIIILGNLQANHPMSGYDIIKYFHRKFHMLPSSGTIYSLLYSMERKDFIEGHKKQRKRVYELTEKGEKFLSEVHTQKGQIQALLLHILKPSITT